LLKEIVLAFQSWDGTRRFIQQHRLLKWMILPGIFYTLLFIAAVYFFFRSSDQVVNWISSKLNIESWLQQKRSEWLSFLFVMSGVMMRLTLTLFYFSLFKYLVLVFGAPLFAYLSEKTESSLENKSEPVKFETIKKDSIRSIRLALRNCGWQTVYFIALIFLSLVPVAGWIVPLICLLMECYYFGFSMVDFSLARNGFTEGQSIIFIGRHKGFAIGNGIVFFFMHILVFLAPAYAMIASTLTIHHVKTKQA
jgi:CysZ protein